MSEELFTRVVVVVASVTGQVKDGGVTQESDGFASFAAGNECQAPK